MFLVNSLWNKALLNFQNLTPSILLWNPLDIDTQLWNFHLIWHFNSNVLKKKRLLRGAFSIRKSKL